jgi:hypothetical protein
LLGENVSSSPTRLRAFPQAMVNSIGNNSYSTIA